MTLDQYFGKRRARDLTVDDVLAFDDVFPLTLKEAVVHGDAPAVSGHTATLLLQLLQQRGVVHLPCWPRATVTTALLYICKYYDL